MAFNPQPKQGMAPKKEKKPLKKTRIKYKKRDTGQVSVFEDISASREWACFTCGIKLWQLTATSFGHVLPKALNKYPAFKLKPENIVLLCDSCHHQWDHMPRSDSKKDPRFDKMILLESELIEEYKCLKQK